ncbi:MAG: 50S ribosomal protein L35ae [Crenarchaeota archaeon]|nr:50S ribosomal protein L35ae [Thermoproteota archaeon]MDW8033484.1 50S ribosomal protein L35ae [Nitrososphaerota archaeon]
MIQTLLQGVIRGPRLGMRSIRKNQYLARFEGVSTREEAARLLMGRKVACLISKKEKIIGRVIGLHGNNGVVRIRFRKGLPEPSNGLSVIVLPYKNS